MAKKTIEKTVFISDEQINSPSGGNLYGRYFAASGIFNVFPSELQHKGAVLGKTSDPQIGGEMVEIFSYPLQVTTPLRVGFSKKCGDKCQYEKKS